MSSSQNSLFSLGSLESQEFKLMQEGTFLRNLVIYLKINNTVKSLLNQSLGKWLFFH
jgi:hypothetical protein